MVIPTGEEVAPVENVAGVVAVSAPPASIVKPDTL